MRPDVQGHPADQKEAALLGLSASVDGFAVHDLAEAVVRRRLLRAGGICVLWAIRRLA